MSERDDTAVIAESADHGRVERAIEALAGGNRVLIRPLAPTDLPHFAAVSADQVTSDLVSQLSEMGKGQIFLALSHEQCDRLGLEMPAEPTPGGYNQVDAIDAREGIGSGLSAKDRAHTIGLASSPAAGASDFVKPGHVIPLRAAKHGVLERSGPTEAAVDLVKACGRGEGAVITPAFDNLDSIGSDVELGDLLEVGVDDVIAYRWRTERLLSLGAAAAIPTPTGDFRVIGFQEAVTGNIHLAFINGDPAQRRDVFVSAHRECLLGSHLRGRLCSCSKRLEEAISRTQDGGGVLIYSQIPPTARRDNPLASCTEVRGAAGECPAAQQPTLEPQIVSQILRELKVESVRWLGEPPTGVDVEITAVERYSVDPGE